MPLITKNTITSTFLERVNTTPDVIGYQFKPTYAEMGPVAQWKELSFRQFYELCRSVSLGLSHLGIQPGEKVAILSQTRLEWSLSDMAILGARAVTVPIYSSNTAEDIAYILEHSESRILFLEDATQLQKILTQLKKKPGTLSQLQKIVAFEPSAMGLVAQNSKDLQNVITFQALIELGKREQTRQPNRFDQNLSMASPEDLITICYTSGTTGVPKGAMITHDNLMSVLEDCVAVIGHHVTSEKETVLSFLPFSHIFGKVESLAIYTFGWKMAYAENIDKLMANMGEVRPTLLFSVPRVFEKAYTKIHSRIDTAPKARKALFHWGMAAGRRYYEAVWEKKRPALRDVIEYNAAKKLVFSKITTLFGGRLRFAVCGGAPLTKEIGEFFQIVGLDILEGYGLTETCAPVAVNTPDEIKFGAVGRVLPEVIMKVAEDGELLIKSRKVFKGYYKNEKDTQDVLVGSWFHTGDIGFIGPDGFVRITDRKKDIIVTSGGKNVAPQKIENMAKANKIFSQFVVFGDRKNYLTALVTLDKDQVAHFANENRILFSEYSELIRHPKVQALTQRAVDEMNQSLASFETIKKFIILPNDFSIETGELTPSLKVKRKFVSTKYKDEIEKLYKNGNDEDHLDSSKKIG